MPAYIYNVYGDLVFLDSDDFEPTPQDPPADPDEINLDDLEPML